MAPFRPTVMTLNLWNNERWEHREASIKQCLQTLRPDVLCVQELRAESHEKLNTFLSGHNCVDDDFRGWTRQSNIYWRDDLFKEIEHGTEDVGISETRRLFWARLAIEGDSDRTVVVSTAHFTYARNQTEVETGTSPRLNESRRTVEELNKIAQPEEPVLFMGDLNASIHPQAILSEAGYTDCFSELQLPLRPTYPARPTRQDNGAMIERPLDWIFANNHARSISATVPHFYHDDSAPSDHWPVLAVYELTN